MRLFRLVKQKTPFRRAFPHAAQVADLTQARPEQQPKRLLVLEFGHVEAKQAARTEQLRCRHDHRFGFADAGWTEQEEAPRAGAQALSVQVRHA